MVTLQPNKHGAAPYAQAAPDIGMAEYGRGATESAGGVPLSFSPCSATPRAARACRQPFHRCGGPGLRAARRQAGTAQAPSRKGWMGAPQARWIGHRAPAGASVARWLIRTFAYAFRGLRPRSPVLPRWRAPALPRKSAALARRVGQRHRNAPARRHNDPSRRRVRVSGTASLPQRHRDPKSVRATYPAPAHLPTTRSRAYWPRAMHRLAFAIPSRSPAGPASPQRAVRVHASGLARYRCPRCRASGTPSAWLVARAPNKKDRPVGRSLRSRYLAVFAALALLARYRPDRKVSRPGGLC